MQSQLPNFIVYEFSCKCVYICGTISCISKEHQKRLYKTLQRTLHMCHWKIWHEAFGECLVQPIKRSADRDKSCTELGLQHKPIILISFSAGPLSFARKIQITDFNDPRGSNFNIYSFWMEVEIFLFEISIKKVTTLLRLNRISLRLFCDHTADMSHFVSDCSDMLCSLLTVTSTVFHLKVP